MVKYFSQICLYFSVITVMVGLAVFVKNDYVITVIYLGIIMTSVTIKKERIDLPILATGFSGTLIGEYLFISTGIETFNRTSLLGIMPLWLPFLWSYICLAAKRVFWMVIKEHL